MATAQLSFITKMNLFRLKEACSLLLCLHGASNITKALPACAVSFWYESKWTLGWRKKAQFAFFFKDFVSRVFYVKNWFLERIGLLNLCLTLVASAIHSSRCNAVFNKWPAEKKVIPLPQSNKHECRDNYNQANGFRASHFPVNIEIKTVYA